MAPEETDLLFVVPAARFVAARKTLAAALRAAGRREEAAALEKRPRPSVATWATNQVARSEPGLIRELGEVTARLQAAGGPDYAEAIAQHRAVLKTLRAKAEGALGAAVLRAALPVLAQVLQNLRVGMASPETRPLVAAGRLVQDIATTEEAVLFDGAGATAWAGEGPGAAGERPHASAPAAAGDGAARDREAREAERLRDKERERREQRATLQREAMRLRSSVEAAEAACASAEGARAVADVARQKAEQALAAANTAVAASESRLAAARATLERKLSELSLAEASLAALD